MWCDSEGICNPIEEGEHRGDVDSLGDLRFRPTMISQALHIFGGGAIRRFRHLADVLQQPALRVAQTCCRKIALRQRLNRLLFCSLNTQEESMRVQSIWTAIEI